ncbi:unnamed protein product [Urochloa decumbens]|uniref:Centromere protein O n=1 Tax=Urochloa decumbens TaxID=240449 RepID=A0ABC9CH60_9POAL
MGSRASPPHDYLHMHVEQLRRRHQSLSELTYARDEDAKLETTRARLSNILKRHEDLKERLSRDSDKLIFERLQKEFEAARTAQTEEISIDDDEWNDGLLATIREKVHMEADRKVMANQVNVPADLPFQSKTTYRIRNMVIYCLDGARIGIQYETFFAEILQAYIDRREQVRLIKELYGNQIGELFHSLPYNVIEFVLEDFECKVTVSIRYSDLLQTLPSQARVLAWPLRSSRRISTRSSSASAAQSVPFRLSYAEEALKTLCLPEAYADIVLDLPHALKRIFSSQDSD